MLRNGVEGLIVWLPTTALAAVMKTGRVWAVAESIHFLGLTLLIGCVGAFDLRLLGVGRRIPIPAMHGLVRWGVAGFAMNAITGIAFFTTFPAQYVYNPAFQLKALLMAVAGINIVVFYTAVYTRIRSLQVGGDAPTSARVVAGVSLLVWLGVTICGRLLPTYRELHWCWWC